MDEARVRKAHRLGRERPAPTGALAATRAFAWRAMLKVRHVPEQLLDVTVTPIMFTLMFTYLFGGAIAGSTAAYRDYLVPGILVQTILFTTVYSGVVLNTDMTKGVVDRFRSLPIWRGGPLVGALLGDSARYVLVGPRDRRARPDPGLPPRRRRGRRGRRDGARDRVRLRHVLDLHHASAWCCAHPTPCSTPGSWASSR